MHRARGVAWPPRGGPYSSANGGVGSQLTLLTGHGADTGGGLDTRRLGSPPRVHVEQHTPRLPALHAPGLTRSQSLVSARSRDQPSTDAPIAATKFGGPRGPTRTLADAPRQPIHSHALRRQCAPLQPERPGRCLRNTPCTVDPTVRAVRAQRSVRGPASDGPHARNPSSLDDLPVRGLSHRSRSSGQSPRWPPAPCGPCSSRSPPSS